MIKKVFCPLDCFDSCAILAEVRDGKVLKLSGSRDHPVTQGFLCKKGYRLLDKVYSENRIKKPLLRVKNHFHEIDWNTALDLIAEKLDEVLKRYSSSAILYYSGDGYEGYLKNIERLFFDYLGGATYSEGSLCWGAGLLAQKADFGNSLCHSPFDLFNSNWIVLWGRNALWTNLHLYYLVLKAKNKGKKVMVIDVYKSPTFRIADAGILIRPSSDSYLAYGAIKYIIESGKEDRSFIDNYSVGFEEVEKIARGLSYDEIAENCGVSKEVIEQVAEIFLQRPVSTFIGYGPQRYTNGVNTIRAIDYLVAISGNVGIKGGGANFAHRFTQNLEPLFKDDSRAVNKRFYNRAKLGEHLKSLSEPPIEFVYISAGNPVSQCPDSDLIFRELQKRFVVNVDMFLTAISYASTLILPAASFLEKEDVFIPNMWHDYIGISEKAIEKIGEAKSEVEIINELAKRLGLDFPVKSESEWIDIVKQHLEKNLNIRLDGHFARGCAIDVPWEDRVFSTKSRKFEFKSEELGVAVPALDHDQKPLKDQLRVVTIHSDKTLHSQEFFKREKLAYINPLDAKRLNISNRDKILIYNGCGGFILEACISDNVGRGFIVVEEGFQNENIETINSCLFAFTAEKGSQAAFNSNFVFVRKVAT
ncbi:molybdopterin-dependent oxidoreductase [Caldicellulosiruptor morganii]|uniref:Molybdopterin-dependent oxidoreductase n=1 Tax=Caldicellulosiruptor morganii TaxID=1387555 RepID=A0ABY7BJI0_9FIRM|nr:molybdopterin-dependent oxidoreductase [Caldicellulosiruptor morganii]WAM32959.1 molybdopterin-dependent oxidoreductase [Caldicellulosiruptor morganii]